MFAAVEQLTWQGKDGESQAKSILPAAQWVRAALLLEAAVDSADDEQSAGYTCKECKVTPPHPTCLTVVYDNSHTAESSVCGGQAIALTSPSTLTFIGHDFYKMLCNVLKC